MKAARIYGAKDVRVEDVELKEVGAKDVKIEVAWAGICGSDLHAYTDPAGGLIPIDDVHPLSNRKLPLTLGHEFSGTITEVGSDEIGRASCRERVCSRVWMR